MFKVSPHGTLPDPNDDDNYCRKCGSSWYIEVVDKHGQKQQLKIHVKVLRYLDFIKRLQRLFITEESAKMMKWEVVFKVSPHGKLPDPNEDDYYNINPMTYEGVLSRAT